MGGGVIRDEEKQEGREGKKSGERRGWTVKTEGKERERE